LRAQQSAGRFLSIGLLLPPHRMIRVSFPRSPCIHSFIHFPLISPIPISRSFPHSHFPLISRS